MAVVTASIKTSTVSTQSAALPGTVTSATVNQNLSCNLQTSGTAADEANLNYVTTLSVTSGTPVTIDLTALTDRYGGAVDFARVRSITVWFQDQTDGHTLTIAPGAANGWTALLGTGSTLVMQASSAANNAMLVLTAPQTTGWVVSGTSKTLTLTVSAGTQNVVIEINGCSS
jgi:hypothetical protein